MKTYVTAIAMILSHSVNASTISTAAIQEYINENSIDANEGIKVELGVKDDEKLTDGLMELEKFKGKIDILNLSETSALVQMKVNNLEELHQLKKFSSATLLVDTRSEMERLVSKLGPKDTLKVSISFKSEPPLFTINGDGSFEIIPSELSSNAAISKRREIEKSYNLKKINDSNFTLLERFEVELTSRQIEEMRLDPSLHLAILAGTSSKSSNDKIKVSENIIAESDLLNPIVYTIQLKIPDDYMFATQFSSLKSALKQDEIFSSILSSIIEENLPGRSKDLVATTAGFGMISLNRAELIKLLDSNDPRIASIEHNKMKSVTSMAEATSAAPGGMNLAQTWSANQGENAWIAILDTGVNLDNLEFSSNPGRQFIQGCFNTNDPSRGISGHCIGANSLGDTQNLIFNRFGGYSNPCVTRGAVVGGTQPAPVDTKCDHGNAVASVALGSYMYHSAYRGVSFGSHIFAINFMSLQYDARTNARVPTALSADYAAALNAIKTQALSKKNCNKYKPAIDASL